MRLLLRAFLLAATVAIGLTLLACLTIYVAQLPDEDRCLQAQANNGEWVTFDLTDGRGYEYRHYMRSVENESVAPDQSLVAYLDPNLRKDGKYTLVIRSTFWGYRANTDSSNRNIDVRVFDQTTERTYPSQSVWSQDSRFLAYLWYSVPRQALFLSTFDLETNTQRTTPEPLWYESHPFILMMGWSGDNSTLLVRQWNETETRYTFFAADTLTPRSTLWEGVLNDTLTWSPSGTELALLDLSAENETILHLGSFATPRHMLNISVPPRFVQRVTWSPDGSQVAIISLPRDCDSCEKYWRFDLFLADGTSLWSDERSTYESAYGLTIPGFWSPDGDDWYWFSQTDQAAPLQLLRFNGETHDNSLVISNLSSGSYSSPFESAPPWNPVHNDSPTLHRGAYLLLPADTQTLTRLDLRTNERQIVFSAAGEINSFHEYPAFGTLVKTGIFIHWTMWDGSRYITYINYTDGSQFTSNDIPENAEAFRFTDTYIYFIETVEDQKYLGFLDYRTGEQSRIIPVPTIPRISIHISPNDPKQIVLLMTNAPDQPTQIYLINLDEETPQLLSEDVVISHIHWSKDGNYFFYSGQSNRQEIFRVLTSTGTLIYASGNGESVDLDPMRFTDCAS